MSGHSKFSNIKYRKERQDSARGKIFSKLSKEIIMAVKQGGGPDPASNATLATAIERAKSFNVPRNNIERAIKRATGELPGMELEEFTYEGYGPEGVAVMLHVITDNRNRTATELRHLFQEVGGSLEGSVAWMFQRRGIVTVPREGLGLDPDEFTLQALDWGAEDVDETEETIDLYCDPSQLKPLLAQLKAAGVEPAQAEVTMVPHTTVKLEGNAAAKLVRFIQKLDDHEDVQNVYANYEVPDEVFEQLAS